MKIKSKNFVQLVVQAITILVLFLPIVYKEEIWMDTSGRGGEYMLKNEISISFFQKLRFLNHGHFLGVLAFIAILVVMLMMIIQVAKRNHIQLIPSMALVSSLLFFFYSLTCTQEPWDSGWGPSVYCKYETAFGFVLILALQIVIILIGFISNSRIKENGIIDEEKPQFVQSGISNADELGKFKELLDKGVITQEEFDAKKKQLLGL